MPSKAIQIAETDVLTDLNITDGTAEQVLTTDGAGSFSFQDGPTSLTDLNITDGTDGQVLTTDGASTFSFQNASSSGSHDFVATGAIANGDIVGLRSDGTVEVVGEITIPTSAGTPAIFRNAATGYISAIFDSNSNKVVIAYAVYANMSGYVSGAAIVGTVSGTSISFGTPVTFHNSTATHISATFDSNSNKVVIAYQDANNGQQPTAIVGTVSGNSISFGTPVIFTSGSEFTSSTFDSNTNTVVIASRGFYGYAIVGTVSGTSISFGSAVIFSSDRYTDPKVTFDSNSNKVVIAWGNYDLNTSVGTISAIVGTVSGTSISFGTPVTFHSTNNNFQKFGLTFDSNSNKVVIAYRDQNNSYYGTAVVGTVSGNSITFGTPVVWASTQVDWISPTFDSSTNKVVIAYTGNITGESSIVVGTVSGTTISFEPPVVFESASADFTSSIFDSNSNKVVIAYHTGAGRVNLAQPGSTGINADTWIGIAAEDIADTASGPVKIKCNVAEGLTGLTTGTCYYVNYDGTLTATENAGPANGTYGKIGRALSSTELLISHDN